MSGLVVIHLTGTPLLEPLKTVKDGILILQAFSLGVLGGSKGELYCILTKASRGQGSLVHAQRSPVLNSTYFLYCDNVDTILICLTTLTLSQSHVCHDSTMAEEELQPIGATPFEVPGTSLCAPLRLPPWLTNSSFKISYGHIHHLIARTANTTSLEATGV